MSSNLKVLQDFGYLFIGPEKGEMACGEFGEGTTFPQVLNDQTKLGGCSETIKYLREQKLL